MTSARGMPSRLTLRSGQRVLCLDPSPDRLDEVRVPRDPYVCEGAVLERTVLQQDSPDDALTLRWYFPQNGLGVALNCVLCEVELTLYKEHSRPLQTAADELIAFENGIVSY